MTITDEQMEKLRIVLTILLRGGSLRHKGRGHRISGRNDPKTAPNSCEHCHGTMKNAS